MCPNTKIPDTQKGCLEFFIVTSGRFFVAFLGIKSTPELKLTDIYAVCGNAGGCKTENGLL
jgi:hypothetical protein